MKKIISAVVIAATVLVTGCAGRPSMHQYNDGNYYWVGGDTCTDDSMAYSGQIRCLDKDGNLTGETRLPLPMDRVAVELQQQQMQQQAVQNAINNYNQQLQQQQQQQQMLMLQNQMIHNSYYN